MVNVCYIGDGGLAGRERFQYLNVGRWCGGWCGRKELFVGGGWWVLDGTFSVLEVEVSGAVKMDFKQLLSLFWDVCLG